MLSAPCQHVAQRGTCLRAQRPLLAAPCARRMSTPVRAAQDPSGVSSSNSTSSNSSSLNLSDVAPLSLVALQLASAAHAEEENFLDAAPTSPQDYLIFFFPILLYGVFYVYREKVNPRARLIDFVTLAAGAAIVANIASIAFLRTRLF